MKRGELLQGNTVDLEEAFAQLINANYPEDPVSQALINKAILQAAILSFPETEYNFGDKEPVDLGIFRVFPTLATRDWTSPSGKLVIASGDTYLDFHLPKPDDKSGKSVNDSYSMIAEYMKSHPEIGHIIGVTYPIMAMRARIKQHFVEEELVLPEEIMIFASVYWQNMMPDLKSEHFKSAHMVWRERNEFINEFGRVE